MPMFYESIEGWFDFEDIYEFAIRRCGGAGGRFVEIGAYKGRSTCYLAERIRESGLDIRLDVVDTFDGDSHVGRGDLWSDFAANLERAGLLGDLTVHRRPSVEAAAAFEDGSLDFIFIDASHDVDAVRADLAAWWPKLRLGGLLGGHDYTNFTGVREAVDAFVAEHDLGPAFRASRSSWMIHRSLSIDAAYCINLARRPDRRRAAAAQFAVCGLSPEVAFFEAVDGATLAHPGVVSDGQAGCSASHLAVVRRAVREGHRHVLVFEDDVELVPDFAARLQAALMRCPASYDLCYVGALCVPEWGNFMYPFDDVLSRAGSVLGTHAYIVNLNRHEEIEAGLRDGRVIVDHWYHGAFHNRGNAYCCTPFLAFQTAGYSDIANSDNNNGRGFSHYVYR